MSRGRPEPSAAGLADGWLGRLDLAFAARGGRTTIVQRRQRGPLVVQRPFHPEGGPCHCYLLHPPGGVVGGDRLEIGLRVEDGGHALVTTPGAAKLYRSAGPEARIRQRLSVAPGAALEWLPQECILFRGARLSLSTELELEPGARFIGWEVFSLGRPVIGERFDSGAADLGLAVDRAGVPLLLERLRIDSGLGLDGVSGVRGHPVTGTLLASGAGVADLAAVRAGAASGDAVTWASTLIGDLLVARCLAQGVEPAHRLFRSIWGILRPRILGRPPCPPRIWAT